MINNGLNFRIIGKIKLGKFNNSTSESKVIFWKLIDQEFELPTSPTFYARKKYADELSHDMWNWINGIYAGLEVTGIVFQCDFQAPAIIEEK